jgi:DNA-binding NtrC family response regulator
MAVEATRMGAYDFLEKPIALPKLLATVARAMQAGQEIQQQTQSGMRLGQSAIMKAWYQRLEQLASYHRPIVLVGEAGCGMEWAARHLLNAKAPWFAPENLEWLGNNPFQPLAETQGGIIFIADLMQLSIPEQQGLMQLVSKLERYHIRLICGSTRSLDDLVVMGHVAADFLVRSDVLSLVIPPLREHAEDIPEIALAFLNRMIEMGELPVRHLTSGALNVLQQQRWPGNLPMLANAVRTLALTSTGVEITSTDAHQLIAEYDDEPSDLEPDHASHPKESKDFSRIYDKPLREARDEFEKGYFEYHLKEAKGNMSRVAEKVGLERTHLYRKLKQLGIHTPLYRNDRMDS